MLGRLTSHKDFGSQCCQRKTCKRQFCRGFQWPPEWHYMFSRVSLCKNHHLLGFHRSMLGKSEPKIFSQVVVGERWSWIPTAQSFTYHLKQIQESCAKKKRPWKFWTSRKTKGRIRPHICCFTGCFLSPESKNQLLTLTMSVKMKMRNYWCAVEWVISSFRSTLFRRKHLRKTAKGSSIRCFNLFGGSSLVTTVPFHDPNMHKTPKIWPNSS